MSPRWFTLSIVVLALTLSWLQLHVIKGVWFAQQAWLWVPGVA